MKMILATAALLVLVGGASAGSDHYGSGGDQQPATTTDTMHTASTKKPDHDVGVPQTVPRPNDSYGQGIWGH
ncbi:MAG: DUF680 domain-containing protein [Mesorhizobium sp.]|nr:MAG: DUF680 domain-containing protein [Mesorhizobium sp.]TKB91460.1 MAG: DUF680 domain-containing protein [Mesorhizobium sp.]